MTCIGGFPINAQTHATGRESITYQVLDRGYLHEIVHEYSGRQAEGRAWEAASALERGEDLIGGCPHGTLGGYGWHRCRCPACREAKAAANKARKNWERV